MLFVAWLLRRLAFQLISVQGWREGARAPGLESEAGVAGSRRVDPAGKDTTVSFSF